MSVWIERRSEKRGAGKKAIKEIVRHLSPRYSRYFLIHNRRKPAEGKGRRGPRDCGPQPKTNQSAERAKEKEYKDWTIRRLWTAIRMIQDAIIAGPQADATKKKHRAGTESSKTCTVTAKRAEEIQGEGY